MEIIDRDVEAGADRVQIAFTDTGEEAALVRGLLAEAGIPSVEGGAIPEGSAPGGGGLGPNPRRIFVRATDASPARKLLSETMVAEPSEEIPESANARYLADAEPRAFRGVAGGMTRGYSIFGATARFYLAAFIALALAFGVFVALR